jgi:Uma2 family endonuclease
MSQAHEQPYYTYADFLEWDESEHCEILDGEIVMMGTPSSDHQRLVMEFAYQIRRFLEGKPCKVFPAPFSVRLNPAKDDRDDTVLVPDIVVICDSSKIDKRGCKGPPDMLIEILSPSSIRYDRLVKYRKYQQAGVREYWVVDPETKSVQACILENGRYMVTMYDSTETAPVSVLPGCAVDLAAVFAE